jgi:hypothetical protein
MRRGFDGKSYTIQYGIAYHKYRELVEKEIRKRGSKMTQDIHEFALTQALIGFEEPPVGHKHEHLSRIRLSRACLMAKERIEEETRTGKIVVTRSEDSFDLELPFYFCETCGWTAWADEIEDEGKLKNCPTCEACELVRARHGGRVDQFVLWSVQNKNMIRDFKTTSYKGKTYELKFDPNSQMTGYVWAGGELSGKPFDGVLIETVYNTKTLGPEITQTFVQFSKGQMEQWQASLMMEHQFIRTMWARLGELGYLAFPMRTSACTNYGGCRFRDACRAGSGWEIDNWLKNYTIESHWDFANPEGEEAEL